MGKGVAAGHRKEGMCLQESLSIIGEGRAEPEFESKQLISSVNRESYTIIPQWLFYLVTFLASTRFPMHFQ